MTDSNIEIRQAGQLALEACIIALPPQMSFLHKQDLMRMALLPLQSIASSASSLHGAILTCTVLASSTQEGEDFVSPSWKLIMKVKERDSIVSAACMDYLSVAAKVDKAVFSSEILHPTMRWLVEAIKREKDQVAGKLSHKAEMTQNDNRSLCSFRRFGENTDCRTSKGSSIISRVHHYRFPRLSYATASISRSFGRLTEYHWGIGPSLRLDYRACNHPCFGCYLRGWSF
jgi:hypothetical protein